MTIPLEIVVQGVMMSKTSWYRSLESGGIKANEFSYRNVILILYEPIDQAHGVENHVGPNAGVIRDDPLVESF